MKSGAPMQHPQVLKMEMQVLQCYSLAFFFSGSFILVLFLSSIEIICNFIVQSSDKGKDGEGPKQDLRSRGLCLVPISSTYTVTNEVAPDIWTPTFGGSFR